jgi:hypothetical protein
MSGKLRTSILCASVLFLFGLTAPAQKSESLKPLPETATLAETRDWLIVTLPKYGSYKTRLEAVTLGNVKFDSCDMTFTHTRKLGSISTATMGATRTTNVVKTDIAIDLIKIRPDGISVENHIYPELRTLQIWMSGFDLSRDSNNGRVYEIVVKTEAAEPIKTALVRIQRLCKMPS